MRSVRTRFWIEAATAAVSTIVFVLTLAWREWVELLFGLDPDQGDSQLEWLIIGGCLPVSLAFSLLARREWQRARAAASLA